MQPLLQKQSAINISRIMKRSDAGIPITYDSENYSYSDQLKELQILNIHESDSSEDDHVNNTINDEDNNHHNHQITNQTLTNYHMNDNEKVIHIFPYTFYCTNKTKFISVLIASFVAINITQISFI